jgi:hypothetical protein
LVPLGQAIIKTIPAYEKPFGKKRGAYEGRADPTGRSGEFRNDPFREQPHAASAATAIAVSSFQTSASGCALR